MIHCLLVLDGSTAETDLRTTDFLIHSEQLSTSVLLTKIRAHIRYQPFRTQGLYKEPVSKTIDVSKCIV